MNRRYIVTNHFYPEHTHISHFVMGTVTNGEIKISVGEIVFYCTEGEFFAAAPDTCHSIEPYNFFKNRFWSFSQL